MVGLWPSRALKANGWQSSSRGLIRIRLINTGANEFVADLLETVRDHSVQYGSGSDRIQVSPPLGTVRER